MKLIQITYKMKIQVSNQQTKLFILLKFQTIYDTQNIPQNPLYYLSISFTRNVHVPAHDAKDLRDVRSNTQHYVHQTTNFTNI